MRKLIVTSIVSLDGYVTGPGGNVMTMPMDHAFDSYNAERLRAADTLLLGRNTYEGFLSFWPRQADNTDPQLVEMLADQPSRLETIREISRLNNAISKVVVSDTLSEDDTGVWRDTTRIVRRSDAHKQVAELKEGTGGDILVFGSRTLWNDLLAAGLVDELHLMVGAVVVGDGIPAFDSGTTTSLQLIDTRRWDGSENFLLRYAVK
jgi:dihydrofolate reductase